MSGSAVAHEALHKRAEGVRRRAGDKCESQAPVGDGHEPPQADEELVRLGGANASNAPISAATGDQLHASVSGPEEWAATAADRTALAAAVDGADGAHKETQHEHKRRPA